MSDDALKTTFTDTAGRVWNLRLSVAKALLLKDRLGFDVEQILDTQNGPLSQLVADTWQLVKILCLLTEEARKEQGVSEEQFLEGLEGETLDEATSAFLNGVATSLKKLKRRTLAAMVRQVENGTEEAARKFESKILEESQRVAEKIDSAIGG
jgi:hypothetical protein